MFDRDIKYERNDKSKLHALRKFTDTQFNIAGVHPNSILKLMGQKTGFSDIYFRPTAEELYHEYKKAVPFLTISEGKRKQFEVEKSQIGKTTMEQKTVLGVLLGVLSLMFTIPLWQPEGSFITNSVIAILGGISLFILPKTRSESLMNWAGIERLPYGLLFLLGGGFALSLAFVDSGLANWIANSFSFVRDYPFELVVIILVTMIMFLTNVKSNTATAAIFIPIVGTMAVLNEWSPLPILFGITVATSFAFLLPMGTPPNPLIYEKAKTPIKEMIKHGIILNLIAITLISLFTIFLSTRLLAL